MHADGSCSVGSKAVVAITCNLVQQFLALLLPSQTVQVESITLTTEWPGRRRLRDWNNGVNSTQLHHTRLPNYTYRR